MIRTAAGISGIAGLGLLATAATWHGAARWADLELLGLGLVWIVGTLALQPNGGGMPDNMSARPLSTDTIATDYIGGSHRIRVKLQHGADGSATDVSAASPLPVTAVASTTSAAIPHTLTGTPPASQAVVEAATTYLGVDIRETGGTSGVTIVLYDNASAASGTILGTYSLVAGESRAEEFVTGRRASNGIYAAISGSGTIQGSVFASS